MRLRDQRTDKHVWWLGEDDADIRITRRYLDEPFHDGAAGFAVGRWLPGCSKGEIEEGGPANTLLLSHALSQSWASLTAGADKHEVTQYGPRRLWDELEAAYDWGVRAGQTFWLDSPEQLIPTP
jgi:hypothetical protein